MYEGVATMPDGEVLTASGTLDQVITWADVLRENKPGAEIRIHEISEVK